MDQKKADKKLMEKVQILLQYKHGRANHKNTIKEINLMYKVYNEINLKEFQEALNLIERIMQEKKLSK